MRKILIPVLAALALAPAARAAETRLIVVDFQKAMMDCEEGKAAIAAIKKESEDRGKQLESKGKELEAMLADFDKQAPLMDDKAKQAKIDDLRKRRAELDQSMMKMQDEVNDRLSAASRAVGEKMRTLVKTIAEAEGYQVVIDKGAVAWVAPSLDITQEVIRKYNAKYGAGTTKATPKPASGAKPGAK